MGPSFAELEFTDSALRHGFGPGDVGQLIRRRPLILRSRRGEENVYELLGRNAAGEYLHVVGRRQIRNGKRSFLVFHVSGMNERDRRRYRAVRRGRDG